MDHDENAHQQLFFNEISQIPQDIMRNNEINTYTCPRTSRAM